MNRTVFFERIRESLFAGSLTQQQVDGIVYILDEWELAWGVHNAYTNVLQAQLAYVLATPYLETGRKMWSVKEDGGNDYYHRKYDIEGDRPHKARELGNCYPGDGCKFPGQGLVQLTGRANYQRQTDKLGIDLVSNPELLLNPDISARVLVRGMIDGDFTGKKLNDYIHADKIDFVAARWIINGKDRRKEIAGYAESFYAAIEAAVYAVISPAQQEPVILPQPEPNLNYDADLDINTRGYKPPAHQSVEQNTGEAIESYDADANTPGASEPLSPTSTESINNTYKAPGGIVSRTREKISGWKTHTGMFISGALGIAAMLGYIPGMTSGEGAALLQTAFGVSGFRSGIPKIIQMGISFYLQTRTNKNEYSTVRR